ncbi:MAG: Type 1 glutamine amidotransferase-like domain-containing protein [Candidatus Daviesbacteria bacterium]|nr:Type 1 glutamine amidotransferase-like domain-containing protein [Candidatus Daviesbacteria bacterium]
MKLLLTSAGLTNKSITNALKQLADKPFEDLNAVFIPTAAYPEVNLQWLEEDIKRIQKADVIFVGGGNTFYLSYWMQKSGLSDLLPELLKTRIYVGISAGSMIVTNNLRVSSQALEKFHQLSDEEYEELGPKGKSLSKTAKLVDFVIRPHLNSPQFSKIRLNFLSKIAKNLSETMYAIDDQSAVLVNDKKIEIISEGKWKKFN